LPVLVVADLLAESNVIAADADDKPQTRNAIIAKNTFTVAAERSVAVRAPACRVDGFRDKVLFSITVFAFLLSDLPNRVERAPAIAVGGTTAPAVRPLRQAQAGRPFESGSRNKTPQKRPVRVPWTLVRARRESRANTIIVSTPVPDRAGIVPAGIRLDWFRTPLRSEDFWTLEPATRSQMLWLPDSVDLESTQY